LGSIIGLAAFFAYIYRNFDFMNASHA
jgi:hypothetical protein